MLVLLQNLSVFYIHSSIHRYIYSINPFVQFSIFSDTNGVFTKPSVSRLEGRWCIVPCCWGLSLEIRVRRCPKAFWEEITLFCLTRLVIKGKEKRKRLYVSYSGDVPECSVRWCLKHFGRNLVVAVQDKQEKKENIVCFSQLFFQIEIRVKGFQCVYLFELLPLDILCSLVRNNAILTLWKKKNTRFISFIVCIRKSLPL